MKYLFFVILSTNVVLFIWELNHQGPNSLPSTKDSSASGVQIKLVSELEMSDQINRTARLSPRHCYQIGPFDEQVIAQQWVGHFADQFVYLSTDSKLVKSKKEYQLYISAADSKQLAQKYAENLRSQGFVDFSVAANHEILLAWYTDLKLAETAQKRLRELGWNSQTRTRELLKRQFFISLASTKLTDGDFLQKRNWPTKFQNANIIMMAECPRK